MEGGGVIQRHQEKVVQNVRANVY